MTDSTLFGSSVDIEVLDQKLSELTEVELAYRDGRQRDWFFPTELLSQEEGPARIGKAIFLDFTDGSGIGRGRKPMAHDERLFVFRTLRFEPALEHVHDFIELAYVYRGTCRQHANGQDLTLEEGQVLFLDADCPHFTYPLGEDDILVSVCAEGNLLRSSLEALRSANDPLTHLLTNVLDERADHARYYVFRPKDGRRIRVLFQEILCEYIDPSPNAGRMLPGLFQLLLVDLLNVYQSDIEGESRRDLRHKVSAVPIVNYIQENYLDCTLEKVAEHFFVSPNYVSRVLKRDTGKTYQQLVQELRISHAASLIGLGGYSAEDAARAVGYTNMSFFYRKFRQAFGKTPAEFRASSTS